MSTEFRFIPEGKGYSVIQGMPAGTAMSGDRRFFIDGADLLKFLDTTLAPTAERRADWETQIANRAAFSVFIKG
jgi:hypothetical protein